MSRAVGIVDVARAAARVDGVDAEPFDGPPERRELVAFALASRRAARRQFESPTKISSLSRSSHQYALVIFNVAELEPRAELS